MSLITHFACPDRAQVSQLQEQIQYFENQTIAKQFLDAVPDSVVVLNEFRQVVYGNNAFYRYCNADASGTLGKRFGEIIGCEKLTFAPNGCGTSRYCALCGAVNSILACQHTQLVDKRNCRLTTSTLEALELEVNSTFYRSELGGFVFFTFKDISSVNRMQTLERLFYHDILNTVSGIRGIAELLPDTDRIDEFSNIIVGLADELIDEIHSQRIMFSAQNGELQPQFEPLNDLELFDYLKNVFLKHEVAKEKSLVIDHGSVAIKFLSDSALLRRVLVNLVKNAFEATEAEGVVKIRSFRNETHIVFEVSNDAVMPEKVRLQVFNRSFSTKGTGRGLGTYSIRLLCEKYLNGEVGFESEENSGTVFRISIPLTRE